jgi:hypothetical protein
MIRRLLMSITTWSLSLGLVAVASASNPPVHLPGKTVGALKPGKTVGSIHPGRTVGTIHPAKIVGVQHPSKNINIGRTLP